jgi:hypothetical protein
LLQAKNNVVELDLSDNGMGKGIIGLPPMLAPKFSIITTLHLRGNKLGDREARVLCDALVLNTTCTYVDVSVGRCR